MQINKDILVHTFNILVKHLIGRYTKKTTPTNLSYVMV